MTGGIWTEARQRLYEQLQQRDGDLAGFYRHVVDQLSGEPEGGRHRLVMMCHAVREMVNNLPEVFTDVAKPDRIHTGGPREALVRAWSDDAAMGDPEEVAEALRESDSPMSVRGRLISHVALLVARESQVPRNRDLRHSATVLGRPATRRDPTLRNWMTACDWFEKHAHLDRSRRGIRETPPDDVILRHLSVIEDTLLSRFGGFFDVMAEVSGLLAEANATRPPIGEGGER